jgi:hypothetical protein
MLCTKFGQNPFRFSYDFSKKDIFIADSNETLQMFKYTCTFVQMHVFSTSLDLHDS